MCVRARACVRVRTCARVPCVTASVSCMYVLESIFPTFVFFLFFCFLCFVFFRFVTRYSFFLLDPICLSRTPSFSLRFHILLHFRFLFLNSSFSLTCFVFPLPSMKTTPNHLCSPLPPPSPPPSPHHTSLSLSLVNQRQRKYDAVRFSISTRTCVTFSGFLYLSPFLSPRLSFGSLLVYSPQARFTHDCGIVSVRLGGKMSKYQPVK